LLGLGKAQGQDALRRLDMLTREVCGTVAARHLKVTHDVGRNVKTAAAITQDIDGNVQALDRNVKVVEQVTLGVDDSVKVIKDGAQKYLIFVPMLTKFVFVATSGGRDEV
jgi:hypothetical protein